MTRSELLERAKPILFNTEMVRAIQDGRKTVTRRVVKSRSPKACGFYVTFDSNNNFEEVYDYDENEAMYESPQSRLHIGDILYVRETWFYESSWHDLTAGNPDLPSGRYLHRYVYKAESPDYPVDVGVGAYGWKPSIHMPKEAARIFLRVTGVHVERLQDIITGDYKTPLNINREGLISPCGRCTHHNGDCKDFIAQNSCRLVGGYIKLWNSTVEKSDLAKYGWAANPWVWVIEFERVEVTK